MSMTKLAVMILMALATQTRLAMTTQVRDTAWLSIGERWGAASDPGTAGRAVAAFLGGR